MDDDKYVITICPTCGHETYLYCGSNLTIYEKCGSTYPFTGTCPSCKTFRSMEGKTCSVCGWTDTCIMEKCPKCQSFIRHEPGSSCQMCGFDEFKKEK